MTLEQLRIFVAVAEHEHVTRAAERLNLTQSATSAAVAALERRYNTKLFDRIGRNIFLTKAGKTFLDEARAVLARAKGAEAVLAEIAGLQRGALTIAASQTVGNYWLPKRLRKFREDHPNIALDVRFGNTEQAAQMVRAGSADIAIVEGTVKDPALIGKTIAGDRLVVVVGRHHPWAKQSRLSPQRLKSGVWALREKGSGTRAMFEESIRRLGVDMSELRIGLELPSNEAIREVVEAGGYVTAISDLVIASAVAAGGLRRVKFELPKRPYLVLQHREHHTSPAEHAFLKIAVSG